MKALSLIAIQFRIAVTIFLFSSVSAIAQSSSHTAQPLGCQASSTNEASFILIIAIEEGSEDCVRRMLDAGAPPDKPPRNFDSIVNLSDSWPIARAALGGNINIVRELLRRKIDPRSEGSEQALLWASYRGFDEIVRELLDAGVSVNAATKPAPPLSVAASFNRTSVVALLLSRGADVSITVQGGATALMFASDNSEIVKLLVKGGSRLERKDAHGRTALYFAVLNGQLEKVGALLELGAKTDEKDDLGTSICDVAAKTVDPDKRSALLKLFAKKGACLSKAPL